LKFIHSKPPKYKDVRLQTAKTVELLPDRKQARQRKRAQLTTTSLFIRTCNFGPSGKKNKKELSVIKTKLRIFS
jgi:hypothetical protein